MATLPKELRRELAKTVTKARDTAEKGARKALEALAVDRPETFGFMGEGQKALRKHLRAHGRQVGDTIDAKKAQTIDHLALECAYEHWHRMLFARFLAENELLIEPETKVAIGLDECRELALERGADWLAVASEFAVRMLPQIFRGDDPVLAVTLPMECRQELERLLEALPQKVFVADDSLGWVYQFWQADKKDAVNASGTKIGPDELSAVTQLFTEDYIVLFLLHNTIGAWWAGKVLQANPELVRSAASEDDLRKACAVGGIDWTYLRFHNADGKWRPASGTFDSWPKAAKDVTILDPCMGSGHFLVFALPILAAIRAEEESLPRPDALLAVLRDNLHGLELDARCTQIAAFNLALATWKETGHRPLPPLRLACSGIAIAAKESDWVELGGGDSRCRQTMSQLFALFRQAPALGSLIDPKRLAGNLFSSTFDDVRPSLTRALAAQRNDVDTDELAIYARGLVEAADLLTSTFTLVVTNVPYLGRGKHGKELRDYCEKNHPLAKADLATCFVERALGFCDVGGSAALVTPQNWLFLGTYKHLRKQLLLDDEWNVVARLGEHAFDSAQAAGAFIALPVLSASRPDQAQVFLGIDASAERTGELKARTLSCCETLLVSQSQQLTNPDHRISFSSHTAVNLLSGTASSFLGLGTGDYPHYGRLFWEFAAASSKWAYFLGTVD